MAFQLARLNIALPREPVPGGHIQSIEEAEDGLALLGKSGPSPAAFTFREHLPSPDDGARVRTVERKLCPAG
jgi:hypothetical protein